jgi:hypothetical protein
MSHSCGPPFLPRAGSPPPRTCWTVALHASPMDSLQLPLDEGGQAAVEYLQRRAESFVIGLCHICF